MSMAMALQGTRDYLRTTNTWDYKTCGIQFESKPPNIAGQWYVALDDAGVDTGPDNTDALTENFSIDVGIWRRPGGLPNDRQGELQKVDDIYLANIQSLHDLERLVISQLHNNWTMISTINTQFSLDNTTLMPFNMPWIYRGRSKMEGVTLADGTARAFLGRRLRFRGMRRIQKRGSIS